MRIGFSARRSVFMKYVIPYALVLLVVVLLCVLVFVFTYRARLHDSMQANRKQLENAMHMFENALFAADGVADTLLKENLIAEYMRAKPDDAIEKALLLQKNGVNYTDNNPLIAEYAVYSYNKDTLLLGAQLYPQPELVYEKTLKYGMYSYREWVEYVFMNTDRAHILPSETASILAKSVMQREYLLYTCPYVDLMNGKIIGRIAFYLEPEVFTDWLPALGQDGMVLKIMDENENTLYVKGGNMHDGRGYYTTRVYSDAYGLYFTAAIPRSALVQECFSMLCGFYICVMSMLLAVILIVLFTILRDKRPVAEISKYVVEYRNISAMSAIRQAMMSMDDHSNSLSRIIDSQKTFLRDAMCRMVVYGGIRDTEEFYKKAEETGLTVFARQGEMRAVYIALDPDHEGESIGQLGDTLIPLLWESERLIACLSYGEDDFKETQRLYAMGAGMFSGGVFDGIDKAYISFDQARQMMNAHSGPYAGVCRQYEPCLSPEKYNYSVYDEERILTAIRHAAPDAAIAIIRKVYEDNFVSRALSEMTAKLLYYRILSTLNTPENARLTLDGAMRSPGANTDPKAFFDQCEAKIRLMCEEIREKTEQKPQKQDRDIRAFIEEHYMDPNMGLAMLSTQFGRSEAYLSVRLKEILGESFSGYLEKKRIDKANALFREGKTSVIEVSQMVGYASSAVFGRAYKRVMGITPKQYMNGLE